MKFSNEGESGGFRFGSHEIPGNGVEWLAESLFNVHFKGMPRDGYPSYRQLPEECKKIWRERAIQWLAGLNEASFSH
jgi:hypothetical protein